jgi:maltose-binding protein MalE
MVDGVFTVEDGAIAGLRLLDHAEPPTAVVCALDVAALGLNGRIGMTTMKTTGRVALMAAASVLALSTAVGADTIRFWTTEEQPERLPRQEEMAADFTAETGIEVEVIPVTESDLGTRATAAFAAGDLPDVIYHTLQYACPGTRPASSMPMPRPR